MTPNFILLSQFTHFAGYPGDCGNNGNPTPRLTWINTAMITQMTRRGEDTFTEISLGNTHINVVETPAEIMTKIINAPKGTDLEAGSERAARQA